MFMKTYLFVLSALSIGVLGLYDVTCFNTDPNGAKSMDCNGAIQTFCESVSSSNPPINKRSGTDAKCIPNGGKKCTFSAFNGAKDSTAPPSASDCLDILRHGVVDKCTDASGGSGSATGGDYKYSVRAESGSCDAVF